MASLNGKTGGIFKNSKILWAGIALILIFVFVGTLYLLKSVYQTETYYVLNADVPTRTQITMDMLTPVVTSAGTAPGGTPEMDQAQKASEREAILSEVQAGSAYTQFPLKSGDVLSPSNVGALADISVGVPDNWVITSFNVDFNNAVQGRIQRGSYFDIMMVSDTGSYYPFVNVLTLETATGGGTTSAQGEDPSGMNSSTSVYTVGMSPENAAKLQWLRNNGAGDMKLVLSPRQNEYASPNLAAYRDSEADSPYFFYDALVDGVIAPGLEEVKDAEGKPQDLDGDGKVDYREITDYTFAGVERDQFGRPVSVPDNVGFGNAKIPANSAGGDKAVDPNAESNAETNNGTPNPESTGAPQTEDDPRVDLEEGATGDSGATSDESGQ